MASATHQLPLSKALEIAKCQNGDMDPAGTRLDLSMHNLWQRVQAQPSTYMFTKEEFAVFLYHCDAFRDDEIAQQAVRRFLGHQRFLKARGEKRTAVSSPQMAGEIAFENERREWYSQALAAYRAAAAWQTCLAASVKCDAKRPACTACKGAGTSSECTYDARKFVPPKSWVKQRKSERFARRDYNVDEGEDNDGKAPRSTSSKKGRVAADRKQEIEGLKEFSKILKFRMLIKLWNKSVKRPDEPTTRISQVTGNRSCGLQSISHAGGECRRLQSYQLSQNICGVFDGRSMGLVASPAKFSTASGRQNQDTVALCKS